jgi:hypothetical protein
MINKTINFFSKIIYFLSLPFRVLHEATHLFFVFLDDKKVKANNINLFKGFDLEYYTDTSIFTVIAICFSPLIYMPYSFYILNKYFQTSNLLEKIWLLYFGGMLLFASIPSVTDVKTFIVYLQEKY